jgi:hypothetical protein
LTQAQMYTLAMQMSFCQTNVMGLLLFHVQDEPDLSTWQSGEFYVDGSPKASLFPVRAAAATVHRGIAATCPGLALTPKLVLVAGRPAKTGKHPGEKVFLTCSIDCSYTVTLDSSHSWRGTAVGRVTKTLLLPGKFATGPHAVSGSATALLNAGPPAAAGVTFAA